MDERPLLVSLLARLKRELCPRPRHNALQFVALAKGAHTVTTLKIAVFHESWVSRFALSAGDAMAVLHKDPSAALVFDRDSHKGDWANCAPLAYGVVSPFTWWPTCHRTIYSWR